MRKLKELCVECFSEVSWNWPHVGSRLKISEFVVPNIVPWLLVLVPAVAPNPTFTKTIVSHCFPLSPEAVLLLLPKPKVPKPLSTNPFFPELILMVTPSQKVNTASLSRCLPSSPQPVQMLLFLTFKLTKT